MENLNLYKNKLIQVYYDESLDCSECGYLLSEDESYILLHVLRKDGVLDGYELIKKNIISSVSDNSSYLKKIIFLKNEMSSIHFNSLLFQEWEFEIPMTDLRNKLLKSVIDNKIICHIELFDPEFTFTGFIKDTFENKIIMYYFNEEVLLNVEEITNFYFDRFSEKQRLFVDSKL